MCGICGSLSLGSNPLDPAAVRAMMDVMVHRGPDAEGMFHEPGIAAGIRRLAVIDIEGGDQPIANEDGSVQVVFNGEIYNHRELRDRLAASGHRLRTQSDTEVLVHLWEDLGPEMVHRLDGMFAFCIHDRNRRESFIARDRLGIKPLYLSHRGDRLIFASELRVLLRHPELTADVDHAALIDRYCLQFVPGDRTVYRGVRELLPGHALHVKDGSVRESRWYTIPDSAPTANETEADAAETLRRLLRDSVDQRLIADVPLGLFLSGGIDSTAVLALVSERADRPVRTFTVGFEDDAAYDERSYARLAAEHFGAEHHELPVSPVDIAEYLPRLNDHLAEPVVDPAIIPTYLLAEFARREVTVVLTGEGADELFGGYRRYLYQQRYGWLGAIAAVGGTGLSRLLPGRVEQAIEAVGQREASRVHLGWAATLGSRRAGELFHPAAYAAHGERAASAYASYFPSGTTRLADQLRADQHEWLPHNLLAKVDRATMAHSLEARVPFLDHRVVDWAATLGDTMKIRGSTTKRIVREAFRDRLPSPILDRPKRGFDLPLARWIRGPLRSMATDLITPASLARWDGLNVDTARRMLDRHLAGREDHGLPLFNLLSVMHFLGRK